MSLQQNTFFDSPPQPQVIYLERKTKGLIRKSVGKTGKTWLLSVFPGGRERVYFWKIGLRDPLVMVVLLALAVCTKITANTSGRTRVVCLPSH